MTPTTLAMLVTSGVFAGTAAVLSWTRSGPWRSMSLAAFRASFAATIRVADTVQPALLAAALLSSVVFVSSAGGVSSLVAAVGATGLLAVLLVSSVVLVPLQRRILRSPWLAERDVVEMRDRWLRGHRGRSIVAMASFALLVVAAAT
jgi:hypothetical protein